MTVCCYHVTYAFQSESTLYSCLNLKELLARSRREIWSLRDWNWTRTHNQLVHERTLNHLSKLASLAKWLSVRLWTNWLWVPVQLQSLQLLFFTALISFYHGAKPSDSAENLNKILIWPILHRSIVWSKSLRLFKSIPFSSWCHQFKFWSNASCNL